MAAAQGPFLAAVLLLVSSGLHWSSALPACPEPCTCQTAPLLNCSSSGLSLVPQHIQDFVTELDLSHNLLDSVALGRPHHNLRNVRLGNNSIARLSLCIERNLGSRYVRSRHPPHGRPSGRRGCVSWAPTLHLLSVERNQLEQLPEGLEGSESLQVLQLSFNKISTLQLGDLSHLRQLKELHLQHNLITSLHPQMFQDLAQLRVLDLSFNLLTSLHPLMYLSLRNIGADVRLGGNRWQCDCSMRSLRRRMAYDSSRGLQAWSMVCASPSVLSGRDLLQLEEDDLNCFSPENRPELHQDVMVYSGSEILLSCSTEDSTWWTPSGQASGSQPQAGLLINDITERDTGLYVCVSEEHEVVSVFNLQISKIGGARRKTRSLPRTSRQIIPQGVPNRNGQERNQRAAQSDLALAVCLSVFITFLIAFILGVLARPCIDVLWRRVTKKKSSSATNSVPSVEQREYDNEAYSDGEQPEQVGTHRERRVTFSTVDFAEDSNVQYYDTVASGDQESINNYAVVECEGAEAENDTHTAGDSRSEHSLQQSSPEDNQKDLSGRRHNIEFEHIPDPVELEERRSLSSCSDSSQSDKVFNADQTTQRDHVTPKSPQLAEDSVQQRADFSTAKKQISIEGRSEIPEFSSEPFTDRSPYTNHTNLKDPDLWQEDGEQFEFSDSVRSTSARSSSVYASFNDSKQIVAITSDKQKRDDTSSSSSCVSEDEPTQYTVNSDHEEGDAIERNHNKPEVANACLTQDPVRSSVGFNQGDYRYDTQRPAVRPEQSSSSHSSDSDEEDYTVKQEPHKGEGKDKSIHVSDKRSSRIVTGEWNTREKVKSTPRTKRRVASLGVTSHGKSLDNGAPPPPATYSSSSSSESEAEITDLKVERKTGRVNEGIKFNEAETLSTDLGRKCIPQIKRRLDIKAPSPPPDSSSSSDSEDETTNDMKTQEKRETHQARPPIKVSQTINHDPKTQWPALDLEQTTRVKRRLDVKAPSPDSDSSSSSDSEDETTHQIKKQEQGQMPMAKLPIKVSQTVSHDRQTKWPALDLEHTTRIKRRLDIKTPSLSSESSSSSDSGDETTHHRERPGEVDIAELAFQKSQTVSHDPETRWPALDLEHIPHIKRRLDIKAPSPPPDSYSNSEVVEEKIAQIKKHEQGAVNVSRLPFKESQAESRDPEARWPALDLEHTTRIKRRLDVKAPSPDSDSSSSSDSEDETTHHIKNQEKGQTHQARLPIKVSQTSSHDLKTQWPVLDLEHTTRIKRRLDVKAPSPDSDSSSSSDSEDETTHHTKKERPGVVGIAGLPSQEFQTESYDPDTRWPALDLEHIPHIKRRLDIKAPSPPPDSSSSSDSEDETSDHKDKQRPGKVDVAELPFKKSPSVSHEPETRWPALDLEHIPHIKRRLDIKAPSPPPDSSSSSDSEDETSDYKDKQRPGKVDVAELPFKKSPSVSHEPETRWPALDLEHIPHIKRRLDIKAPSPPPDSSSSSDSEDETTNHLKKQKKGEIHMGLPVKVSQTVSHDPKTQWPALDLEHTTRIKRRLDVKAPSPDSDSSSSSDSEDETSDYKDKQRPGKVDFAELPFKKSPSVSHEPETQWPALDLEHTTHIKRRLDVKAPSPASDSSSSNDSEDETTHHTKKERPGMVGIAELPFKESQTGSHNPETQWPAVNLGNIPHIKRRLDMKALLPPPDSLLSGGSTNHTVEGKRKEAIKMSPHYSSSSSDEQEESMKDLSNPPTTAQPDPDSRWPELGLSSAPHVKRRLDIKARSPPPESSSSSDESQGGTTDIPVRVERDKTDVGITSHQPGKRFPDLNMSVPKAREKEFIRSPKTPVINISHSPKTDHSVKLEKYKVITNDMGDKTSDNISTTPEINPELESRWATMNLGISRFRKRLEITSHAREPPNVPSSPPPDSPSSSSNESGIGSKSSRTRRKRRGDRMQGIIHTDSSLIPENKTVKALSLKDQDDNSGNSVEVKERLRKYNSFPTTEEKSNPDTMLTGFGTPHFRRNLDIKASEKAPDTPPLRQLPDSTSSSESEDSSTEHAGKGWRGRSQLPVVTDKEASQNHTSLYVAQAVNIKLDQSQSQTEEVERKARVELKSQTKAYSSSSSVPDLGLGVPRVKRRLDIKAPLPEQSNSPSSCSESENEGTNMSGMTDNDSLITYKRSIIKALSPQSNSSSPGGQTIHHANQRQTGAEMVTVAQEGPSHSARDRNASLAPRRVPSISFDDIVKKKIEQSRRTTDVDLPPEIRWTGVGRHLSDLSDSSPRRHLGVGLSPQQTPPAEPELPPPDSPNPSCSTSDDKIKQDGGKANVTLLHKYSSLSANSVTLASSRSLDKFDNALGSTNEILRAVSGDRMERKGLSALKVMSSERQKWDTEDGDLDKGPSPLSDDHGLRGHTSFNYRRSEEDIRPLAKQPLSQLHLSSTSVNRRRAADLLYGIPRYRSHNIKDIEPLQEAPPPIPATQPPDEAVGLTWRSPQSSKRQGWEGTRSYLQQSRNTEESDPSSLTSQNLAVYFDSPNISDV